MTDDGFVTAQDEDEQGAAEVATESPKESEKEDTQEEEQDAESDKAAKGASEGSSGLLDYGAGIVAGKVDDTSYV